MLASAFASEPCADYLRPGHDVAAFCDVVDETTGTASVDLESPRGVLSAGRRQGFCAKSAQLLSLGLGNFEVAPKSMKLSTAVRDWVAEHGGQRRVSYNFASKDGRLARRYDSHRELLLDSLFANFPEIAGIYDRSEVVLLDCRALRNAEHDWRLTKYAGYHPKNLEGLLDSKAWGDVWREAMDSLDLISEDLCSGYLWSRLCGGRHGLCAECHPRGPELELSESVRENALKQWLAARHG